MDAREGAVKISKINSEILKMAAYKEEVSGEESRTTSLDTGTILPVTYAKKHLHDCCLLRSDFDEKKSTRTWQHYQLYS